MTRQDADDLETALADVQLLGTPQQVEKARRYIKGFGPKAEVVPLGPILEDVCDNIRMDLGLAAVTSPIDHLRLHLASESSSEDAIAPGREGQSAPEHVAEAANREGYNLPADDG